MIHKAAMGIASFLLATGGLAGCGFSGSTTHSWSEEVDTGNGETLRVDRKSEISTESIGARFSVAFPDTALNVPQWNEPLIPLLVYQDPATGEWTLVAAKAGCDADPYQEYRLSNGGWHAVQLPDSSVGKDANLYLDGYGAFPKSPISPTAKSEASKRTGIPDRYRKISREVSASCS